MSHRSCVVVRCLNLPRIQRRRLGLASTAFTQVEELLAQPMWSIASLLPSETAASELPKISSSQLHHLLKLSALPPPRDQAEDDKMLKTLSTQLHFVKEIQSLDTAGVEPLHSLRDETSTGRKEAEIGLDALRDALNQEDTIGQYHKRIRRRRNQPTLSQPAKWDPLVTAEKKVGRYFIVEGGRD